MEHFMNSNSFLTHSPWTYNPRDLSLRSTSNDSKEKSRVAEPPVEPRIESSETTVKEIEGDKREAQYVIANYGIDLVEMLHMVERWTQTLLAEFYSLRFSFKQRLRAKWEHEELKVNADHKRGKKELYEHIQELKRAQSEHLSKESFEKLRSYLTKIDRSTNTAELKQKVTSVIEIYTNIFHSLEFLERHQQTTVDSSFTPAKAVLEQFRVLNQKSAHSICIIGLEKCGKSTFVNALLGFELVPAASERCTQVRTVLKPTSPDDMKLFAKVEFYDDTTFQNLFEKTVVKSDEDPKVFQQRKEAVRQEQKRLREKFPERKQAFKLNVNERDADQKRREIIKALHDYITNELYVNIIQDIAIYTDKLPGKNYEVADVPGFDSPIKEHRDAGLETIKQADAFLFLTDGNRPSLTRDQIRLLNEIQGGNHYEAMKRAFGVITKLDQCHTPTEFTDRLTKARNELISKGFRENQIFAVCSVINLFKPNTDQYQVIVKKIKNFDNLQDGFQLCQQNLNQFIEFELPKTHFSQLIDFGYAKPARYVRECLDNIRRDTTLNQLLTDDKSSDHHMKEQDDQEWDKIYHEQLFEPTFDAANVWQKEVLTEQRTQFMQNIKKFFRNYFTDASKSFIDHPVNVKEMMMKRYSYTVLHMTSQPVDNQLREELSFKLESMVLQTINMLARYLYDEYVCQLETKLNKISLEANDSIYHSELLSYDICLHELRAMVLRTCRPIITATLRYSHCDERCRCSAIDELLLIAPTIACHLCENGDESASSLTSQIASWTPILKKGIEMALNVYGKSGIQHKITATIFQFAMKKLF